MLQRKILINHKQKNNFLNVEWTPANWQEKDQQHFNKKTKN